MYDLTAEISKCKFRLFLIEQMKRITLLIILVLLACKEKPEPVPKVKTIGDLKYMSIRPGIGTETIKNGDYITVDYAGWIVVDSMRSDFYSEWTFENKFSEQLFQSSYATKKPHSFTVGEGSVIKAWDMGLLDMKVGSKRILDVPANLAYGSHGFGDVIKPNNELRFEVEILSIERPKPTILISESIGEGKAVGPSSIVRFHYKISRSDNSDHVLQDSFSENKPGLIRMNDPGLPYFMHDGLLNLAINGERFLTVPAFKAKNLPELNTHFKVLKVIDPVFPWKLDESKTQTLESGLKLNTVEAGDGKQIQSGDKISLDYSVFTVNGDKLFTTIERDFPDEITIDDPAIISGLSDGLKYLRHGSKARLIIPEQLSSAPDGSSMNLPHGIKLVFDLEIRN
ncbi:MAG: FKBP-type peptidyl-prolyl cis-trans isomerase [Calditrichaeota bacterium]|nr:FKBP-type peptidyl-prolyl cis-trans isomerase [Calditrichota bacterium]